MRPLVHLLFALAALSVARPAAAQDLSCDRGDREVRALRFAGNREYAAVALAATVATLVTRPTYAHALLDAVKSGQVPVAVITPYQARAIRSLNDADLTTKLTAVWGELRDTPEAKKAELADWTKKLTPERLAKGEAAKGKVLFTSVCAACHKLYGEGGMIGPDLTGGDRHKLTYLLENIVDPNAIVPRQTLLGELYARLARSLAAAKGIDLDHGPATPIGQGCPSCTRKDCPQRAAPPVGRQLVINDRERGLTPCTFDGD